MHRFFAPLSLIGLFLLIMLGNNHEAIAAQSTTVTGWLSLDFAESASGERTACSPCYTLTRSDGTTLSLNIDDSVQLAVEGGLLALDRQQVTVQLAASAARVALANEQFEVQHMTPVVAANEARLDYDAMSKPHVVLLCKFADVPAEQEPPAYFNAMLSGLEQYWQELSFGQYSLAGSEVFGWYELPKSAEYYERTAPPNQLTQLLDDCTDVAEQYVDFTAYSAIHIMLNGSLGASWAGVRSVELDGSQRVWPVAWLMDWAWLQTDFPVVKHEFGHVLGLPHSADSGGDVYGNYWDTMSTSWSQHTIGYHKEMLGWISAESVPVIRPGSEGTITIDRMSQPAGDNPLVIHVPVVGSASDMLTVELRQAVGYDENILAEGVVIHDIDDDRTTFNPISHNRSPVPAILAQPVDEVQPNRIWRAGETFVDAGGVSIEVNMIEAGSATVTITNPGHSLFMPLIVR